MPKVIIQKSEFQIKFEEEGLKLLEKISNILRSTLGDSTINTLKNVATVGSFTAPERALLQNKEFRNNVVNNPLAIAGVNSGDAKTVALSVLGAAIFELLRQGFKQFQRTREESSIDRTGLPKGADLQEAIKINKQLIEEFRTGIASLSNKEIADRIFQASGGSGDIRFEDVLGQLPEELKRFFDEDRIKGVNKELLNLQMIQDATQKTTEKLNQTGAESNDINEEQIMLNKENTQGLIDVGDAQSTNAKANKETIKQSKVLDKQILKNTDGLVSYEVAYVDTNDAASDFGTDGLFKVAEGAKEADKALSDIDLSKLLNEFSPEEIAQRFNIPVEEIKQRAAQLGEGVTEGTNVAKQELTGLGVFASDIAANINDSFADLIFNGFKGNFEGLGELWEGTLDTMLEALSQFAATAISNPIRIGLESVFSGLIPSGPIGVPEGEEPGITNLLGGGLGGGIAQILSKLGAFASETIPLIGTLINAAIAVALTAVSLIKGLTKKKPRLDVDLDQIRDEFGRSTGQAAKVLDFLDDEVANSIINVSVKRKAGLGGIGDSGIQKQIREAIQTQIQELQDIINTLPFELAASLNESLLNTEVDIESEVKGDRLLEFDETKNISEKFDQFINGDLQARFLFAIRDFFVGAFESLGVLGSAAQEFIDGEFEKFQGLSREERIEAGKELLQDFQTLTDAFNVINNNGADSIGATVNSIKNLSSSLGFDAVPSIEELDAGLEELISAAELDPDVIQDYLDLRNAILEAQRAILSSITSIISSISSLNSIIVDGGGDAFDLTGFINQGLDSVTGLLGQDGLSVEDREELLGLGTGFLDQLIAEEQAAFQAQFEAAQQAAEAAAEAQRAAVRAQIQGLEQERDLIEENFDTRLEALEEELRIAEEFARLAESIQQTLNSIILGPDSVFTAVERLNIVQGDIASLQSELAATTDPQKQLEIAEKLEGSLETLFDLAGEAFGVNSPEFVAIFDQVTGGLNDLLDLTGNRERSVEEINAEIEALNIERNEQLEAIDAQIESLNEQLSSIQAENVDATFQASDRVQELAEFFRNEYITLLEERFTQLGEVSESGFTEEIEALNTLVDLQLSLGEKGDRQIEIADELLVVTRDMNESFKQAFSSVPGFMNGTNGIQDFGQGTLAILHGREAVLTVDQINDLIQSSDARIGGNVGSPASFISAFTDLFVGHLENRLRPAQPAQLGGVADLFGGGRFTNFLGEGGTMISERMLPRS